LTLRSSIGFFVKGDLRFTR